VGGDPDRRETVAVPPSWEVDMDGRRVSELRRVPRTVPRIERQPHPLPGAWAWAVGAGWPLLLFTMMAVAPEPADPNAVPTFLDSAMLLTLIVGLFGTVVTAVSRQSKALLWSTGLGLAWVTTTVACPVSGHHDAVSWQWYVELTASTSLLLLSLVGLRVLRAPLLRPRSTTL
jgi:hypothetical protein